jgi:hypothetical protein
VKTSRRNLLKLAAAGAGLFFLPPVVREARATLRADAPARRILVLNLHGGIRSSAAFLASSQKKYNPFGLMQGSSASFPLGQLLDDHATGGTPLPDADYTLGASWQNARLPRLREMAAEFSILGTWDEERGDHLRARLKEPTGSANGDQPGLMTRIAAALSQEQGGLDVLPFQLAPYAAFGQPGSLARYTPISLVGPGSLPTPTVAGESDAKRTGNDWARDDAMRERLDQGVIAKRARNAKTLGEVFAAHRRASRQIGSRLAEPWVNVGNATQAYRDAAFGSVKLANGEVPLTNSMLHELFTKSLGSPEPENTNYYPTALNGALALRLLQLGAPAICLEVGDFDFHSEERTQAPELYTFLGRLWATLNWAMKRIPDPLDPSRSLYDTTLILTMSDFSRDPGSPATGYNAGDGSDHGDDPSCYYLAHAVMGAGVKGNRVLAQVSTDDYRGDLAAERYDQRDLLAMTLWALGLDHHDPEWGLDDVTTPLDGLFKG